MGAGERRAAREDIPIVVVLFHREDETKKTFDQLKKVTGAYRLVIVNNGFDNTGFIEGLKPDRYVENHENTGAIQGMNQGIDLADGEYVAVIHNDVLIYDEGWLDDIVEFMERRPDVGLVGMQGAHTVTEEGRFDYETNVVPHRGLVPDSLRPTWRWARVAMIDGVGWVMRKTDIRLDERYGMMHCYDLDLALQYIQAGYGVYVRATDFLHQIQKEGENVDLERSSRGREDYLSKIGGDDEGYFESVTRRFREKWSDMLPVTLGFRDEAYGELRAGELHETRDALVKHGEELERYMVALRDDLSAKGRAIAEAEGYVGDLKHEVERQVSEIGRLAAMLEPPGRSPS
jgi:glycosyltransferase involved in cell wall biosynthesis